MKLSQLVRRPKPVLHLIWAVVLVSAGASASGQEKVRITDPCDLPPHTYRIPVPPSELLASDELFAGFAEQVRADIGGDLEKYDIQDGATLQSAYHQLVRLDALEGHFDSALDSIVLLRGLEERESAKAMTGLFEEAYCLAKRDAGDDEARFSQLFRDHMLKTMRPLALGSSVAEYERMSRSARLVTEGMVLGIVRTTMDPAVKEAGGEVTGDLAAQIIDMRFGLKVMVPYKDDLIDVYDAIIRDYRRAGQQDIWPERSVTLLPEQNLAPVMTAIWDTGVDTSLFAGRLYVNTAEEINGKDDDGNGFVDDLNGIAFDGDANATTELLCSLDKLKSDPAHTAQHFKGFMDSQEGVESAEASEFQALLSRSPSEAGSLLEDLDVFSTYAHGTAVAWTAVEGNPFVRILVARMSAPRGLVPHELSMEGARKGAGIIRATVGYFKKQGVRVVNMSWSTGRAMLEEGLKTDGIGKTDEERRKLAGERFSIVRDCLREEIRSAPDVLFVCAVDNGDSDVERNEVAPPMFDLPNLLRIGAVGPAGERVGLTAVGNQVDVHAQGLGVETQIPGGRALRLSGSSMACPQATNLAAKLIALSPSLKPTEVIDLIKKGADPSPDDNRILLINPKRSVDLLAARKAEGT